MFPTVLKPNKLEDVEQNKENNVWLFSADLTFKNNTFTLRDNISTIFSGGLLWWVVYSLRNNNKYACCSAWSQFQV